MDFLSNFKAGILIQGGISEWTRDIVREYQKNFPSTDILVSTWTTDDIENIPCRVIQSKPPAPTNPHKSTVNHQIVGTNAGLKSIQGDVIMKCRTDQFIHNRNIFKIFEDSSPKNKIMIPDHGTYESIDYRASDFCQIARKSVLLNYWSSIPLYDGSVRIDGGKYLTENYIIRIKKDTRPWKITLREYFYVKRYHEDFQIEWEKLNKFEEYQDRYNIAYQKSAKPDL